MNELDDLKPARPELGDERPAYMPRLPWRWILGVGLFLTLSIGIWRIRDRQEAEALRSTVLAAYADQLAPIAARYQALAATLRADASGAIEKRALTTYVDPRLKLDALGSSKGLTMRVKAAAVGKPGSLDEPDGPPDAIGRCLGLAPLASAELFARGSFLEKGWIDRAKEADSVLRLRVIAEELRQRSGRDLPFVVEALGAQWFLLVVEQGDNRRVAPVDVYLWDLRSNKLLLSARTEAEGTLVAARIAVGGTKPGKYASGAQTGAAQDCSIASQLRALTGGGAASFRAPPPSPQDAVAPAAVPTDAGVKTDGG